MAIADLKKKLILIIYKSSRYTINNHLFTAHLSCEKNIQRTIKFAQSRLSLSLTHNLTTIRFYKGLNLSKNVLLAIIKVASSSPDRRIILSCHSKSVSLNANYTLAPPK